MFDLIKSTTILNHTFLFCNNAIQTNKYSYKDKGSKGQQEENMGFILRGWIRL